MNGQPPISDTAPWKRLEDVASPANRPIDELLGEATSEYIQRHTGRSSDDELPGFVGMLRSGVSDTAEHAERIVAEELARYIENETGARHCEFFELLP